LFFWSLGKRTIVFPKEFQKTEDGILQVHPMIDLLLQLVGADSDVVIPGTEHLAEPSESHLSFERGH
jgi:hypothetical protein